MNEHTVIINGVETTMMLDDGDAKRLKAESKQRRVANKSQSRSAETKSNDES